MLDVIILEPVLQFRTDFCPVTLEGGTRHVHDCSGLPLRVVHHQRADALALRVKTVELVIQRLEQFFVHKDRIRSRRIVRQRISESQIVVLAADGRFERHFLPGGVERAAGANTVAFPDLSLGAAALAVLLGMVAGIPDWAVIRPVDFLADLNGLSFNRDKEFLCFV